MKRSSRERSAVGGDHVRLDLDPGAETLYLFFTGWGRDEPVPQFEFLESGQRLEGSKVYLRDPNRLWYHQSIPGFGSDVFDMAEALQGVIREAAPQRVRLIGNSMGGFAAILFASLLDRGEVVSFVPQTFLTQRLRFRYGHWDKVRMVADYYRRCWNVPRVWDLRRALEASNRDVRVDLFTSAEDQRDWNHARHVTGLPGVRVHRIANTEYGHNVARKLKEDGRLEAILRGD